MTTTVLRIMPIGDSITAGYTDMENPEHPFNFGYRGYLYRKLCNAGVPFCFVGASPEPFDCRFGDPTHGGTRTPTFDLRAVGEDHHRGYGGATISQIAGQVDSWMEEDRPDVMLLMIGINGIDKDSPRRLEQLVSRIFSRDERVQLLISCIPPLIEFNTELFAYNRFIQERLVPSFSSRGYSIAEVDHYRLYLTDPSNPRSIDQSLFSNGINHPTDSCYEMIAETWYKAIEEAFPELFSNC